MNLEAFNQEIDNILLYNEEKNSLHGKVCLVCDKLMKPKEVCLVGLKTFMKYAEFLKGDPSLPMELRQCYRFEIPATELCRDILSKCVLSPRSMLLYKDKKKRNPKVMCCQECRSGLSEKKLREGTLPRFAIANNMAIGTCPFWLVRLNEIELALLSQARLRGHLFTYWGGCHRSIKGWHSLYYEVDPNHTMAVLEEVERFT